jgi:hydroxyethylthiazole kinase-like uncharacterized protein yjeF
MPREDGDKEERGALMIVAGSTTVPGAAILAANAALRSGVGKLTVATQAPQTVAQVVPEARVVPFRVTTRSRSTATRRDGFDAVLIGPGMESTTALSKCVGAALRMGGRATLVLDAGALAPEVVAKLQRRGHRDTARCVLTPHAGEMASLLGIPKHDVEANAHRIAHACAMRWSAVVVLKGATTFIASEGRVWRLVADNPSLAASGSGDVLAGIVAALAARGASADQAAVWGVALHALAGARLARRYGRVGALAREIPDEVPALLELLSARGRFRG